MSHSKPVGIPVHPGASLTSKCEFPVAIWLWASVPAKEIGGSILGLGDYGLVRVSTRVPLLCRRERVWAADFSGFAADQTTQRSIIKRAAATSKQSFKQEFVRRWAREAQCGKRGVSTFFFFFFFSGR